VTSAPCRAPAHGQTIRGFGERERGEREKGGEGERGRGREEERETVRRRQEGAK